MEDSVDVMRLVLLFENPFSLLLIQNKKNVIQTYYETNSHQQIFKKGWKI